MKILKKDKYIKNSRIICSPREAVKNLVSMEK